MPKKTDHDFIMDSFVGVNLKQLTKTPIIIVSKSAPGSPNKYEARLYDLGREKTNYAVVANSLQQIRKCLPANMQMISSAGVDSPDIIEVYV